MIDDTDGAEARDETSPTEEREHDGPPTSVEHRASVPESLKEAIAEEKADL